MTKSCLLTDLRVKQIIKDKVYGRHHDGGGLYLVGNPTYKSFSWIQRLYRGTVTGKNRDVGLGSAQLFSLKEARTKAHVLRQMAADGIDPLEQNRKALAEVRAEASSRVVFRAAAEEFLSVHLPTFKNVKHQHQWRSSLTKHVYPKLGSVPVSEIDAALVNATIMPLFARAPETGSRVRDRVLRICKWISDGRPPPMSGGNGSAKHHPALPYAQLPRFMSELRARTVSTSTRALEFAILTAARTGEVLGADWSEIDLDEKVWIVPAERMKGGREHVVPLSDRVIEVMGQPSTGLIFPSSRGGQMNSLALLQMLKKLDGCADLTVHGFRSTFSDWAGDSTHIPRDVIEHALAHAVKNKVEAAYRRGSAIEKRRKLMELWAQFCTMPASASGKVTPIRRRASA